MKKNSTYTSLLINYRSSKDIANISFCQRLCVCIYLYVLLTCFMNDWTNINETLIGLTSAAHQLLESTQSNNGDTEKFWKVLELRLQAKNLRSLE